jgi:hypothetical protein
VILLLRAVARFVVLVLLVALALAGLAVAVFSIQGGDKPLSLPGLAQHLRLTEVEETVGDYFDRLEAEGPLAKTSALVGAGAVLAGVLLLLGTFAPRRERFITLDDGEAAGTLRARRGTLAGVAEALAEQARGVTEAKARVRPRSRLRNGQLRLTVSHTRNHQEHEVKERVRSAVSPLVESSGLKPSVEAKVGRRGARVE